MNSNVILAQKSQSFLYRILSVPKITNTIFLSYSYQENSLERSKQGFILQTNSFLHHINFPNRILLLVWKINTRPFCFPQESGLTPSSPLSLFPFSPSYPHVISFSLLSQKAEKRKKESMKNSNYFPHFSHR